MSDDSRCNDTSCYIGACISSAVHSTALPPLRPLKRHHYLRTQVGHFENGCRPWTSFGPNTRTRGCFYRVLSTLDKSVPATLAAAASASLVAWL